MSSVQVSDAEAVESEEADEHVVAWRHGLHDSEDVGELGAGEALGGGDPFDAGPAHVEHRIAVEDGVAVVAGQRVELAGDSGERAPGRREPRPPRDEAPALTRRRPRSLPSRGSAATC